MRFVSLSQVLRLHEALLEQSGGSAGLRDLGRLEAALAQPKASFGGVDLYASLFEKAAALCFSIVQGHPFVDGNKRVGHAALEVFLVMNGYELTASVDEQESTVLALASGQLSREQLTEWIVRAAVPKR
ncbi:MAG: type II toxin-antitoxin system death-on-curing family toxin [Polyangiaceae bacterium]|nr:type II toxin-antitoxin system death-on-curing family toxin [Polyangiaceae bacterium]